MIWLECLKSALLGIVQGVTEWLPVSSTGHIILFNEIFPLDVSVEFWSIFSVVIQLGSILAVVLLYFKRLWPLCRTNGKVAFDTPKLHLWGKILIACIPAAIIGLPLDDPLEALLYETDGMHVKLAGAMVIAATLILYGVAFILIERRNRTRKFRTLTTDDLTYRQALAIGAFQCLALIPGTSRSGSTVMGASLLGISRTAAAEFSFFLSVPVMCGASGLRLFKFFFLDGGSFTAQEWLVLAIGLVVAFLVSLVVIRALMSFVRKHSFAPFGWYRIALGVVVLLWFLLK